MEPVEEPAKILILVIIAVVGTFLTLQIRVSPTFCPWTPFGFKK
jgi:hypothetical protein